MIKNIEWHPSNIDFDWILLSKEEFCKKYPNENPALFHDPPRRDQLRCWKPEDVQRLMNYAVDQGLSMKLKEWMWNE